jgi:hypothetical protein
MAQRHALFALLFSALLLLGAPRSEAATISVGPYVVPPVAGTPFLIPIQVTDAVQLVSWSFGLTYDVTELQINVPGTFDLFGQSVTEGPFYAGGAPFNLLIPGVIALDGITFAQLGSLFGVEGAYGGFDPAPSGDGIIAYVEFVSLDGDGSDDTIRVVDAVTVSAVPEPATIALFLGALLLLTGARVMCAGAPRRQPIGQ